MAFHRKNFEHVGRGQRERKTYLGSVFNESSSGTKEENLNNIPQTAPRQDMGDLEPIGNKTSNKENLPPWRSTPTKIKDIFEEHFFSVISFVLVTVAGIIGYLYVQQYGNNRELGEVQIKFEDVQKRVDDIVSDYKKVDSRQNDLDKNLSLLQKDVEYIQKLLK